MANWNIDFEVKVFGIESKFIDELNKFGKISISNFKNKTEIMQILEKLGYLCYEKDNFLTLDKVEKKYVIALKNINYDLIEKIFEGTLYDALNLQRFNGVSEEDIDILVTLNDLDDFSSLIKINYFGDDKIYKEVSIEEYNKTKE